MDVFALEGAGLFVKNAVKVSQACDSVLKNDSTNTCSLQTTMQVQNWLQIVAIPVQGVTVAYSLVPGNCHVQKVQFRQCCCLTNGTFGWFLLRAHSICNDVEPALHRNQINHT